MFTQVIHNQAGRRKGERVGLYALLFYAESTYVICVCLYGRPLKPFIYNFDVISPMRTGESSSLLWGFFEALEARVCVDAWI